MPDKPESDQPKMNYARIKAYAEKMGLPMDFPVDKPESLTQRLRSTARTGSYGNCADALFQAADRIEQLEAALRELVRLQDVSDKCTVDIEHGSNAINHALDTWRNKALEAERERDEAKESISVLQKENLECVDALAAIPIDWQQRLDRAEAAEQSNAELRALMQEGVDGFSRVLVGTSDHKRVYGWVDRCRAALSPHPQPAGEEMRKDDVEALCAIAAAAATKGALAAAARICTERASGYRITIRNTTGNLRDEYRALAQELESVAIAIKSLDQKPALAAQHDTKEEK